MTKKDMAKCTKITDGMVVDIKSYGLDCPTFITVKYDVLDKSYQISESMKYTSKAIKIGFLPIGQRKIPKLGSVVVGSTVSVSYNPDCAEMAFLTDNVGRMNA